MATQLLQPPLHTCSSAPWRTTVHTTHRAQPAAASYLRPCACSSSPFPSGDHHTTPPLPQGRGQGPCLLPPGHASIAYILTVAPRPPQPARLNEPCPGLSERARAAQPSRPSVPPRPLLWVRHGAPDIAQLTFSLSSSPLPVWPISLTATSPSYPSPSPNLLSQPPNALCMSLTVGV